MSKIGFIGVGNMGSAMIEGMLNSKLIADSDMFVYDILQDKIIKIQEKHQIKVANSVNDLVKNVDIIILAVKPDMIESVVEQIKTDLQDKHIIVSIAAGITLEQLHKFVGRQAKIVRCMPNTPALVLEGMTMLCEQCQLSESDLLFLKDLFSSFGKAEFLPEKHMDAFIGICGSSPAYVFMFIEAMADAAVLKGLPRQLAYQFASQAVLGSAKMVLDTQIHPGALKDMVCSPNGTTIEAVAQLERLNFRGCVIDSVLACIEKSEIMSKENK